MDQQDLVSGFADVDRTADPTSFAAWLDRSSAMEFFQRVKRQTYALLELRAGNAVLDVGCGTGEDVRALAEVVGPGGRAVGVDISETLLTEARARAGAISRAEFHLGDARALPFAAASFDGCRAERTLTYLADPAPAVAEMVRVVRPGGRVVAFEPDLEALMVDAPDAGLTRTILAYFCEGFPNSRSGRQLPALFVAAGLRDVAVAPVTLVVADFEQADQFFKLRATVERAGAEGRVAVADGERWVGELEARGRAGQFFLASPAFVVSGRTA